MYFVSWPVANDDLCTLCHVPVANDDLCTLYRVPVANDDLCTLYRVPVANDDLCTLYRVPVASDDLCTLYRVPVACLLQRRLLTSLLPGTTHSQPPALLSFHPTSVVNWLYPESS